MENAKKRKAGEDKKTKERAAVSDRLNEYTTNNKAAATYSNLGIENAIYEIPEK